MRGEAERAARRHRLLRERELFVGAFAVGGALSYWDADDRTLAEIHAVHLPSAAEELADELVHVPAEEWTVSDGGEPLFLVRRYDPADHPSYEVLDPDGEPLGTFFCNGGLLHEEITVRDGTSAPVAEIVTRHHVHELDELHGPQIASCGRVLDRIYDDPLQEVWWLRVEDGESPVDRRVLVAMPLVCSLTSHPKRHIDPGCNVAGVLLLAVPPVGAALLLLEEAIDGWYWLRRKLE